MTGYRTTLIGGSSFNLAKWPATFFTHPNDDRVALHFSTIYTNAENIYEQMMHCMEYNRDFFEILRKKGRLPMDSIIEHMEAVE